MKDIYQQFREQADHIKITPRPVTWDRIELRLRAQRNGRRLVVSRLLNIAAALIVLIAVGVSVMLYTQNKHLLEHNAYSAKITQLSETSGTAESIYDVTNIRRSWSDLGGNHN